VGSGADKLQFVVLDAINRKPIRFDVQTAKACPIGAQGMAAVAGQQSL